MPLRERHSHIPVLAAFAGLTLLLTWPLAAQIGNALPGIPPDTYLYIWNLEWVKQALFDLGTNPYFTRAIYYPTGVSLYYHSLILGNDLLALPLQFAFGTPAAYMLLTLGLVAASGYAMYLFAFELVRSRGPAFFAGLAFTFSPYRMAHLAYSHFDLMPLLWLPLVALAAKRWIDRPSVSRLVLIVILLFWVSITNWYYSLYSFILFGLYALYRVLRDRSWRCLVRSAAPVVLTIALLSPWLVSMLRESDAYPLVFRGVAEADKFSADLLGYVLPAPTNPIWGSVVAPLAGRMLGGPAERTLFLGFTTLALAGIALVRRRGQELYFWATSAVIFLVLSLGPYLHLGGVSAFGDAALRLPLPYALLYQVPGVSSILQVARSIDRFGLMVMLSCAVLAALGLSELGRSARRGRFVVPAACLAVLVEFAAFPLPTTPTAQPAPLSVLQSDPGQFGVLDLPADYKTGAEAMYYWTVDGKPTTNGYHSRLYPFPLLNGIPSLRTALQTNPLNDILVEPRPKAPAVLNAFDIRYVALHKQASSSDLTDLSETWIRRNLSAPLPVAEDAQLAVYRVPPTASPPLIVAFANGWYEPEPMPDGALVRWMLNDGRLLLYTDRPMTASVKVDAFALGIPRRSRWFLNGAQVFAGRVPNDSIRHLTVAGLALRAGQNEIVIRSLEPPQLPIVFGQGDDPRRFTIAFQNLSIKPEPTP